MKKSKYWSYMGLGLLFYSIGMSEVAGQIVHHVERLGPWAYTVGTWGVIMMMGAFLYKEIHSRN